jgi:hypothetical protein
MSAMFTELDLIGRWNIVTWEQRYDDGRLHLPLGERLTGFIRYSSDGDMVCMLASVDRPRFSTGGQWDADEHDRAAAYQSMLAYSGRWSLRSDPELTVTHTIEVSPFPDWIGTEQSRTIFPESAGVIALEARLEEGTAQARTARLVWRRNPQTCEEDQS